MSQRNRIAFAAAALTAALFLAAPSPSHAAAGPPWRLPTAGAWEQAWSWLAHLLPGGAPRKPEAPLRKDGGTISPGGANGSTLAAPGSDGTQSDEGGAINPNGVK